MKRFITPLAATLVLGLTAMGQNTRPIGDSKVVAPVPFPGYPEGIAKELSDPLFIVNDENLCLG